MKGRHIFWITVLYIVLFVLLRGCWYSSNLDNWLISIILFVLVWFFLAGASADILDDQDARIMFKAHPVCITYTITSVTIMWAVSKINKLADKTFET